MDEFDVTLGRFNESLNFIFGVNGAEFKSGLYDVENNPYVRFVALERTNNRTFKQKEEYQFEPCTEDFRLKMGIRPESFSWYSQPLCFKDRDNVSLLNNPYQLKHAFPVIALAYCRNTTENDNWCKS